MFINEFLDCVQSYSEKHSPDPLNPHCSILKLPSFLLTNSEREIMGYYFPHTPVAYELRSIFTASLLTRKYPPV